MHFVMDCFNSWVDDNLEIIRREDHSQGPHSSLRTFSPQVSLEHTTNGVAFDVRAPWWQNLAPEGPPRSVWGLWNFEVVEIFIVGDGGRYLELEINPYGHYLMLMLSAPRKIEQKQMSPKQMHCVRASGGSDLNARQASWSATGLISADDLPVPYRDQEMVPYWRVNSFWCFSNHAQRYHCCAYPLPGEQPNFHQPQYFPRWVLS